MTTNLQYFIDQPRRWLRKRPQLILQTAIIAGALAVGAYLGYRAVRVPNPILISFHPVPLLIIEIFLTLLFLKNPLFGLCTVIVTCILASIDFGTGTETNIGTPMLLLSLLIVLWLFDMVVRQRQLHFFPSRILIPLFVFLIVALISFGIGQLPWFNFARQAPIRAQLGELFIFFLSFGVFILVGHQVRDITWLKRFTWLFLALAAIAISGDLVNEIGRITNHLIYWSVQQGSLFWTWFVALAFGQVSLNRKLSRRWRIVLAIILAAVFYIGFWRNRSWTSGWLPPFVAVIVILWSGFPRLRVPMLIGALLIATFYSQKVYGIVVVGDNQYSITTRLAAWHIIAEIISVSPIFGLGPANYYWYTHLFPILGYSVVFNSHNNYVDIIAQTGLLGFFFFLWFTYEVIRSGWRLRTKVPEGFAQAYVYGALGGLIGTIVAGMLGDWVLPFVYNIGFAGLHASLLGWLFLGGLFALEQMYDRVEKVDPVNQI